MCLNGYHRVVLELFKYDGDLIIFTKIQFKIKRVIIIKEGTLYFIRENIYLC